MTSQFPAALDVLSNPNGNDPLASPGGILHSVQHTNANDVLEAIERKLGIGDSVPGATAGVLRRTGSGASGWGPVQTTDFDTSFNLGTAFAVLLDYKEATDLYSGSTWAANVPQPFSGAKTFTVQGTGSLVEIAVRVGIYNGTPPAVAGEIQTYLLIDGVTRHNLGSNGSNSTGNPFAGAGPVFISGLTPGPHTVQVFALGNGTTNTWYCRCATQSTLEWFQLQVIEHKAGIGVKGDIGPSAQTAGGTKRQLQDSQTADVSGLSCPTTTWTTVRGPLSFTVDDAASLIEIDVEAVCHIGAPATSNVISGRALIDGSISRLTGGAINPANGYLNPFQGTTIWITGLAAGSHTVTFQLYPMVAGCLYYCRPASPGAGMEHFTVTVNEHKQGGLAWVYKGPWSNGATYSLNDVVTYQGSSYVALQTHTNQNPATESAYWGLMAATGAPLVWRGPWAAGTAYVLNDVVTQGGATYIATQASTGQNPTTATTYWALMVSAGSMTNPMTTVGDLIVGGTSGVPTRMAKGPVSTVLAVDGAGVLGYRQIGTADIGANVIMAGNIGIDTINEFNIAPGAIGTSELKDGNVTTAKLAARAATAVAWAVGATAGPAVHSSHGIVAMPDPYVDIACLAGDIISITFESAWSSDTLSALNTVYIYGNGAQLIQRTMSTLTINTYHHIVLQYAFTVGSSISYRFQPYAGTNAGWVTLSGVARSMNVVHLKR